jgi:hypothetical protein
MNRVREAGRPAARGPRGGAEYGTRDGEEAGERTGARGTSDGRGGADPGGLGKAETLGGLESELEERSGGVAIAGLATG